jgi:hypothetical protein
MEDIIFATYITYDSWKRECAEPLMRSFKYFHPEVPFKIFEGAEVNNVVADDQNQNIRFLKPSLGKRLRKDYRRVVLLDADQLVVGPLTELIDSEWDVAGVRSNDDLGRSLPLGAFCTPKIPWEEYLNCGLCGIADPNAWDQWERFNKTINPHMGDAEQGTWNEVFHSGGYRKNLLDPVGGDVIYGTAANSAHWGSLRVAEEKIILNLTGKAKWVKILHKAGCGHIGSPSGKFSFDFDKKVIEYIERIIS